jgi:DNA-binding LacI/PurR family transcriptional regulator
VQRSSRVRDDRGGRRQVLSTQADGRSTATVTLRDVARSSGVSITTVSRILNGRETGVPIREETRQRVLSTAAALGYKPNLLARGLRGSRSSLLGVMARDIGDPFHIQILRGINEVARVHDHRLFLGHVDYRPDVALSYGSMFERSHADGIILIGDLEGDEAALDVIAQQHRHVIGVTDRTTRRQIPGVYSDSAEGTRLALEHLWDLGHRSIVCVSDRRTHDGRLRIDQYERFMRDRSAGDRIAVFVTDQDPEPAFELGRRLFIDRAWPDGATAVYATSDTTAIGLMQAAYQAGIEMPRQLSVVGYDDIDLAPFTIPPLTTVSQDGVEMGRAAADMLFRMMEEGRPRSEVSDRVLLPHLIVRGSTAPPTRAAG